MGVFEDRMGSATVSVTSPDGSIRANLTSGDRLSVAFRPGSFTGYRDREDELARQLAQLAAQAVTGWRQARRLALEAATGTTVEAARDWRLDRRQREYRQRLAQMKPLAKSPGNCLKLTHTGGEDWRANIKPGTVAALSEAEFAREFAATFHRLRGDETAHATRARVAVYGSSDPRRRDRSASTPDPVERKRALRDA